MRKRSVSSAGSRVTRVGGRGSRTVCASTLKARLRAARPVVEGQTWLCGRLDDADHVTLGVVEETDHDHVHRLLRAHDARPAEALGLRERSLDVGHQDVEGDVAWISVRPLSDAAADSDAFRGDVAFARHHPVLHRVVSVDLPPEQLGVVALQLLPVLPDDLEVNDWLTHSRLLSARRSAGTS